MLKLFKTASPYSVIALFVVALCLKLKYLAYPSDIIVLPDQVLWTYLVEFLYSIFGKAPFGYTFLAVTNIVLQGLFLNKISRNFNLFPNDSYLPAFTYIILSSFFADWNYLSAFLIGNWFILASMYQLLNLYAKGNPEKSIFNIGLFIILATLLVFPNILYILLFFAGLAILRPFQIREWAMAFLGIFTPIYFLLAILFLSDHMLLLAEMVPFSFNLPEWKGNLINLYIPLGTAFLFFLIGLSYLMKFSSRMLIQTKKTWGVILIAFVLSCFVSFLSIWEGLYTFLSVLLPFSLIFANLWFEERKTWTTKVVFYILIAVVLFGQWFTIS